MVCPPGTEIEEAVYPQHMAQLHAGSQAKGRAIQQNIPKTNLPPGINPGDLPSPEFLQTVAEMEKAKLAPPPPKPIVAQSSTKIESSKQELRLKYVWQGNCPLCNTPVRTIITKVDGRWFCSAYCISHETVEQTEVNPLDDKPIPKVILSKEEPPSKEFMDVINNAKPIKNLVPTPPAVEETPALPKAKLSDNPTKGLAGGVPKKNSYPITKFKKKGVVKNGSSVFSKPTLSGKM